MFCKLTQTFSKRIFVCWETTCPSYCWTKNSMSLWASPYWRTKFNVTPLLGMIHVVWKTFLVRYNFSNQYIFASILFSPLLTTFYFKILITSIRVHWTIHTDCHWPHCDCQLLHFWFQITTAALVLAVTTPAVNSAWLDTSRSSASCNVMLKMLHCRLMCLM